MTQKRIKQLEERAIETYKRVMSRERLTEEDKIKIIDCDQETREAKIQWMQELKRGLIK